MIMHDVSFATKLIILGNQGEVNANSFVFDVSSWQTLFPVSAGKISAAPGEADGIWLTYVRAGETKVVPEILTNMSLDDNLFSWTPSKSILSLSGNGSIVIHCTDDGDEKRTVVIKTYVNESHTGGEVPGVFDDYIYQLGYVINLANVATTHAEDGADTANAAATRVDTAISDAGVATVDAIEATRLSGIATEAADVATGLADSATQSANDAALLANTNAGLADTATGLANQATSDANDAAQLANTNAGLADIATGFANAATDNANGAADRVDDSISDAVVATGLANDAALLANTNAGLADTATGLANQATSDANAATGLANQATIDANAAAELANTNAGLADTATGLTNQAISDANDATSAANTATGLADAARIASDLAEGLRDEAEIARELAEGLRDEAEIIRLASESDRVIAEDNRAVWELHIPNKEYVLGNKVSSNGSSYVCDVISTVAAPLGSSDWLLIAEKGNVYYSTFEIDVDGHLTQITEDEYSGPTFTINSDGGLEVSVNDY